MLRLAMFLFLLPYGMAYAMDIPSVGNVDVPQTEMIFMFLTIAAIKIAASGLAVAESSLKKSDRPILKGFGYIVQMFRSSLDQIIGNTRKVK